MSTTRKPDPPPAARSPGRLLIGVPPRSPADPPLLVFCAACGADVSRASFLPFLRTPAGVTAAPVVPVRCPECNAPAAHGTSGPGLIRLVQ